MTADEKYMHIALTQAEKGLGHTSPNPCVGAVIVKNGRILARGWHRRAGQPHAEIEAFRALRRPEAAHGATLYVTLEPCSTHGRTPPCCDAIIAHRLARVVVGAVDPNPAHAGRGLDILRAAGLDVTAGILADACTALNRPFNRWIVTGLPWVIAKAGLSLDGRLSRPTGEGQWLTSEASRARAMQLRSRVDAILIGAGTLRADNPRLTLRGLPEFAGRQPWRIVLTRRGQLPADAHLFTDEFADRTRVFQRTPLPAVLRDLGRTGVTSLLIEGGGEVLGQAFDQRLVDEVHFHLAPLICGGPHLIGGRGASSTADSLQLHDVQYTRVGDDVHLRALTAPPGLRD